MIRLSKEDPVDRLEYLDIYNAATQIEDDKKRRTAITLVLLTGRLGLRIGEAIHCHRGWIDWYRGIIQIPEFEPCRCYYCWERSEENCGDDEEDNDDGNDDEGDADDDTDSEEDDEPDEDDPDPEEVREYHLNNRWSPKSNPGSRPVAFNWSHRISAALADFYRDYEVIDEHYSWCYDLLNEHILPKTEFFEPKDIGWHALRHTAQTFWMNTNLNPYQNKQLGGWSRTSDMIRYEGSAPVWLSNGMRRAVGKDPIEYDQFDFVALDPRPFPGEDFDPRDYDVADLINRYDKSLGHNPRSPSDTQENKFGGPVEYDEFGGDDTIIREINQELRVGQMKRIQSQREGDPEEYEFEDPWKQLPDIDDYEHPIGQSLLGEY